MKTIALRFGEHFAPEEGTIKAHQRIIEEYGFVWYGKMGAKVSEKISSVILNEENPQILLIRSGRPERYWAAVHDIRYEIPPKNYIPEYYRDIAGTFRTWFKVVEFRTAEKDVMSHCIVSSSGSPLGAVSKHSMSPYFIIDYDK